jgi:hypothetical protein
MSMLEDLNSVTSCLIQSRGEHKRDWLKEVKHVQLY